MTNPVPLAAIPTWEELLADLGPLYAAVDTEWVVIESMAVLAMAERAP